MVIERMTYSGEVGSGSGRVVFVALAVALFCVALLLLHAHWFWALVSGASLSWALTMVLRLVLMGRRVWHHTRAFMVAEPSEAELLRWFSQHCGGDPWLSWNRAEASDVSVPLAIALVVPLAVGLQVAGLPWRLAAVAGTAAAALLGWVLSLLLLRPLARAQAMVRDRTQRVHQHEEDKARIRSEVDAEAHFFEALKEQEEAAKNASDLIRVAHVFWLSCPPGVSESVRRSRFAHLLDRLYAEGGVDALRELWELSKVVLPEVSRSALRSHCLAWAQNRGELRSLREIFS